MHFIVCGHYVRVLREKSMQDVIQDEQCSKGLAISTINFLLFYKPFSNNH